MCADCVGWGVCKGVYGSGGAGGPWPYVRLEPLAESLVLCGRARAPGPRHTCRSIQMVLQDARHFTSTLTTGGTLDAVLGYQVVGLPSVLFKSPCAASFEQWGGGSGKVPPLTGLLPVPKVFFRGGFNGQLFSH